MHSTNIDKRGGNFLIFNKKPFNKRYWWILLIILLIPIVAIMVFLIAKYCYDKGLYSKEFFELIGAILGYSGTAFLGLLALWQNDRANDINDRLLKLEESHILPYIAINGPIVNVVKYEKQRPNNSYDNISCSFGNPNITFIFPIKNITKTFISRIYVEEIEITGEYHDRDGISKSDVFIDNKIETLILNSFLEPNVEKHFLISILTNQNPLFYSQFFVMMKLKLVYLNNIESNEQRLNFVAIRDIVDDNLYIVTKEVLDEITIKQLYKLK